MKYFLPAVAATLITLTCVGNAPAQSGYYAPNGYSQQYNQPVYPSNYYAQPQIGFSYSSPSFGIGINLGQSYGPSVGVYSRPVYVPSYYPAYNNYHQHYRHPHGYGHGHGHGYGHR